MSYQEYDRAEAERLLKDIRYFEEFAERYLKVQPEEGGRLVPFKMRPIQKWYHDNYIVPRYLEDMPIRDAVLKCRQTGMSTYFEALTLWATLGHSQWNSLVVGMDDEQARTLFRIMKRYDEWIPTAEVFPEFPKSVDSVSTLEYKKHSKNVLSKKYQGSEEEGYFNAETDHPVVYLDSRVEIKSGEKKGVLGRGGTYHTVHLSEAAFYADLTGTLGSMLSCCHERPQTMVFLETTANGMNAFHGFWNNAQIGQMEVPSIWRRIFIPWYWDARYELKVDFASRKKREFEDEYEAALFDRILMDDILNGEIDKDINKARIWGKLLWRRQAIMDKFFGDLDKFKQEFPSTDSEAFIFSGVSIYSAASMARLDATVSKPVWRGDIALVANKGEQEQKDFRTMHVEKEEHESGRLRVKEWADGEHKYAIFADVAEGKAIEGVSEEKSKWDFSAAQVLKVTAYPPAIQQVAIWHGNCDPDAFGSVLVSLAMLYSMAYLGWEINGPGRSLKLQIVDRLRYRKIYMRDDYDTISRKMTKKPGWRTTGSSKPVMVAVSQRFVRGAEIEIFDSSTVSEMKSFSRIGENKYAAAQGHDDRVMAMCGALAIIENQIELMRRQMEYEIELKKEKDKMGQWGDADDKEEDWNPVLGTEF